MGAKLLIAGDLCAAGRPAKALVGTESTSVWAGLAELIGAADFAVANAECPLTDRPQPILKSGPRLWAPTACAAGIRVAGFHAVSLANNHIMDAGNAGLSDTLAALQRAGLATVGAGKDVIEASAPLLVKAGDLDLAVLAFAENEFSTTDGDRPGASPLDLARNGAAIARARARHDFVLVLLHAGVEHYRLPNPGLQTTCRFFVDQGADAVICHHTHVVSGSEVYRGKPIAYGLGNLLFDSSQDVTEDWYLGCLALLEVGEHETGRFELVPCRQDPSRPGVELLTGAAREASLARMGDLSRILADAALLASSWSNYCQENKAEVLESVLGLSLPEAWLLHRGLLPSVRFRRQRKRLARIYNSLTCESRREASAAVLRALLEQVGDDTAGEN